MAFPNRGGPAGSLVGQEQFCTVGATSAAACSGCSRAGLAANGRPAPDDVGDGIRQAGQARWRAMILSACMHSAAMLSLHALHVYMLAIPPCRYLACKFDGPLLLSNGHGLVYIHYTPVLIFSSLIYRSQNPTHGLLSLLSLSLCNPVTCKFLIQDQCCKHCSGGVLDGCTAFQASQL